MKHLYNERNGSIERWRSSRNLRKQRDFIARGFSAFLFLSSPQLTLASIISSLAATYRVVGDAFDLL